MGWKAGLQLTMTPGANADDYASLPTQDLLTLVKVYQATRQEDLTPELENRLAIIQQVLQVKVQAERWKTFSRLHEQRARNNWEDAQALEKLNRELDQLNNNRAKLIRHLRGYMIPAEQMAITELSQFINPRGSINVGELYEWLENIAVPIK